MRLQLRGVDGERDAYQVCWPARVAAIDRTTCSVHGVTGSTGTVADVVNRTSVRYP